ncbi:concanavalin A-like lectin/glucanase superfamily protein [Chitinophaga polysaccharea]|uniref:Concanavalin A-like lectin/glucanase superfamily protein n=1 Tax=Chitinophaga polysaccharea TaxID=1293035 RepID=A0A561P120_9BACT|nr:LamG domain-containing protein [Chitinophaga polysaccharea]TWF31828.1 concanavalin A-like lectin/glucanase superfamily protein [Chitinophaga polysaccharea]
MQFRYSSYAILAAAVLLLSACYKKFDAGSYAPALSIDGYSSTSEIAPGNLVAYWGFNGNLVDSVSKTACDNSGTSFAQGIKGGALKGADKSYALFSPGSSITGLKAFTLTMWVNAPQNTDGMVGLVSLSNTKSFWGNIDIFFENGSTDSKAILKAHVTGQHGDGWLGNYEVMNIWKIWTNIAVSYNGVDTFRVYVNGQKIDTKVNIGFGQLAFANPGKMVFGTSQFQTVPSITSATDAQPWASYLTGTLDEVRIYNKALSDKEVGALVKLEGRGK